MAKRTRTLSPAWYYGTRRAFLAAPESEITGALLRCAAREGLEVLQEQETEWRASVSILKKHLSDRIPVIRQLLHTDVGKKIESVILEYDFRRRGLRIDCLLIAPGALFVLEFKRSNARAVDCAQVMRYATNLVEFHRVTRLWTVARAGLVFPMVVLTEGEIGIAPKRPRFGGHSWPAIADRPIVCDQNSISAAIASALAVRKGRAVLNLDDWLKSPFSPSSTIVDAAVSLYGNHDVSAIREHAASSRAIARSVKTVVAEISRALRDQERLVIFVSGAPGAGKTLVGLDVALRSEHARYSSFVTGNSPLVEVLSAALEHSYKKRGATESEWPLSGYMKRDAAAVSRLATHKIVRVHSFLNPGETDHRNSDGRVIVFDEAQRTYEKGKRVKGIALVAHEADLILKTQEQTFPTGGTVVVALIGHKQAINVGERGVRAWLEAAERRGWSFAVGDETLRRSELEDKDRWKNHRSRRSLSNGHLKTSMRFYRNASLEKWSHQLLDGSSKQAMRIAGRLKDSGHPLLFTRDIEVARQWARKAVSGEERSGIVASSQGRRLSAHGLFVEQKPSIAHWMLLPSSDIRSSSMLETVQNQYQVQGLEIDYTIVCWDADLRASRDGWDTFKISGDDWERFSDASGSAKNSYRVLLTRARKGMIIFVPRGDSTRLDVTRLPEFYDGIVDRLSECGARELSRGS